ncbi:class I SAM-dependent methyltransferase [Streptomyces acidiscabies]|uniref:class I SAM-dependent methyltransferase n=1 Tax=Streptomyces acidiscabies TaxID=42234 RepID=UPI000AFB9881|nr:class I SAM-dependent methyltransferase [Streptomyces acidiscabies]
MNTAYWDAAATTKTFTHLLHLPWLDGVDTSPGMIAQARRPCPGARFAAADVPLPGASFDLVLLFAVLTCVPDDDAQHLLIAGLRRVLKPGGLLYVSDLLLQDDVQSDARYERHGVFETSDGLLCRHHSPEQLAALLSAFDAVRSRTLPVPTMNGHPAKAIQLLVRTPKAT